jgi:hypothetical protein
MSFDGTGTVFVVDAERAEWLRTLAEAARAASDELRALDDPALHGALIDDLDAFRDRIAAELRTLGAGGDDAER